MPNIQRRLSTQLKPIPPAADLSFGRYFTDHWIHARFRRKAGWSDLQIEPYGAFSIDPAASVLHYGQALFEGMKAFTQNDGKVVLFRPDFNCHRMHEGAKRLCLEPPPRELFMQAIRELVSLESRWVPREPGCSLYIRPTLIGTEPFLGVRPSDEVMFFVILSPVGAYYAKGFRPLRIWIESESVRAAPGGLGATKAGANYAASLQAALHAKDRGFDQVLWLDVEHSGIEEVGTMNVFFVFKDEIVTPALDGSILAGGMRDSILHVLRHEGAKVSERRLTVDELMERQERGELLEAFGTGTAAVIAPIGEFCHRERCFKVQSGGVGTLSQRLLDTMSGIQSGRLPDPFNWIATLEKLG